MDEATLILLRHGESVWNAEDRFAGTVDVPLSDRGRRQALEIGRRMHAAWLEPSAIHTSELSRATETVDWLLVGFADAVVPVHVAWELDERDYGALQGRRRQDVRAELGDDAFRAIRRSWTGRPPGAVGNRLAPRGGFPVIAGAPRLPNGETLCEVSLRVVEYWRRRVLPDLEGNATVLVVAHGNSLRALVKEIEGVSDEDVSRLEVEVARPLVYRFADGGWRRVVADWAAP